MSSEAGNGNLPCVFVILDFRSVILVCVFNILDLQNVILRRVFVILEFRSVILRRVSSFWISEMSFYDVFLTVCV